MLSPSIGRFKQAQRTDNLRLLRLKLFVNLAEMIVGIGYTPAFSAVFRSLVSLAPPDKRAELIASIYVVAYLAFSIPSFIAGVAVTHYSLRETTYVYGLVVMALSAITTVVLWRHRASPRAAVGAGR
jgi:predicted MFS family arabinose efflux permease